MTGVMAEPVEQTKPITQEITVEKKQGFSIDVFTLDKPMHIVGRSVRVTHGTPECFPTIQALWKNWTDDDAVSKIPNKKEPAILFGISTDHVRHALDKDIIEFTYILGVEVNEAVEEGKLPETMRGFTIPPTDVARIKVSHPNGDAALGIGYVELSKWLKNHPEWEDCGIGETEVYVSETPEWVEFEKWSFVKRKEEKKEAPKTEVFRPLSEAKAFQKEFEIFKMPASRVIGKEKSLPLHGEEPLPARPLWEALMKSGDWGKLKRLPHVVAGSDFGWTCDYVAATDTFRLSISPGIGILTRPSQFSRVRRRRPSASPPSTSAMLPFRSSWYSEAVASPARP